MAQLGFHFDQSRCTGCKACAIACKDSHDHPVGLRWRRVAEYAGGTWLRSETDGTYRQDVFSYYTSYSCNHCDDPICVQVCPSTAMHKGENGIVSVNADVCIGCRYCEMACPYSAPQFNPASGVMTKCDLCADRLRAGQTPACVAACTTRALEYGDITELRARYGTQAAVEPLPASTVTRPNIVITPHRRAQASGTGTGRVGNPEEI